MVNRKRQFSAEFKSKVALSAIREEGTLAELSSRYNVNPNMVSKWKQQALGQMTDIFSKNKVQLQTNLDAEMKTLHAKIGELTIEKYFLEQSSKKLGVYNKW